MIKKKSQSLDSFDYEYIKEALLVAMESNQFPNTVLLELANKVERLGIKAKARELNKICKCGCEQVIED